MCARFNTRTQLIAEQLQCTTISFERIIYDWTVPVQLDFFYCFKGMILCHDLNCINLYQLPSQLVYHFKEIHIFAWSLLVGCYFRLSPERRCALILRNCVNLCMQCSLIKTVSHEGSTLKTICLKCLPQCDSTSHCAHIFRRMGQDNVFNCYQLQISARECLFLNQL